MKKYIESKNDEPGKPCYVLYFVSRLTRQEVEEI